MAAHNYWRLNFAATDGGSTLNVAEIELHTSVGGSNVATSANNGIVDRSASARALTINAASQVLSPSSLVPLGTGSCLLPGNGNGIVIPASVDMDFGTGDWTIGMRINVNSLSQADNVLFAVGAGSYGSSTHLIDLYSTGKLIISHGSSGNTITSTATLTAGTWYDVEISKASGTLRMFINGALQGSVSDSDSWNFSNGNTTSIGFANWASGVTRFPGYIDELYVMKGAARHTAAYTPASSPINSSDSQWSNIKLLLNFDLGDGQVLTSSGTGTNAFDSNNATNWALSSGTIGWITYQFGTAQDIIEHAVTAPNASATNAPNRWTIQYSDDGLNWTTAAIVSGQTAWSTSEKRTFTHSSYPASIGVNSLPKASLIAYTASLPSYGTKAVLRQDPGLQTAPMISGTVKENGVNVARTVRAYCRLTGEILGETVSDASTGAFSINARGRTDNCYVVALDDLTASPDYNAMIYDLVTPV